MDSDSGTMADITKRSVNVEYEEVTNRIRDIAEDCSDVSISIRDWVRDTAHKTFRTGDIFKELCTSTDEHGRARFRSAMHSCLGRMVAEGKIARLQDTGHYRKIEGDLIKIDYLNAPREEYNIVFPFDIPTCVFPGNTLVIAGQPNAGKTSFLLNVGKLNMDVHKVNYFDCQMGGCEFRKRLEAFKDINLTDWCINAYERSEDFASVVEPNALNLIDYVDDKEAFYMKSHIQEIHEKIKKGRGVAIIAIQKHKHKEYGYGGEGTTEAPRLYINLKWDDDGKSGIIKLVKAKNWRGEDNPNGKMRRYWIYDKGSRWEVDDPWRYPEDDKLVTKSTLSSVMRR